MDVQAAELTAGKFPDGAPQHRICILSVFDLISAVDLELADYVIGDENC